MRKSSPLPSPAITRASLSSSFVTLRPVACPEPQRGGHTEVGAPEGAGDSQHRQKQSQGEEEGVAGGREAGGSGR